MRKLALIMVLMLIFGLVFISGCVQQQNYTGNNSNQSGYGSENLSNKTYKNASELENESNNTSTPVR